MRETNETRPGRTYKDTVFRMLFREKQHLLSLYNAVNRTAHTDVEQLEITTLENAVYLNYKNDISFVMDFELMLYEHQSTVNPNMPLRHLIYVTKILQGITRNDDIYGSALIRIPTPRFVVFYNGTQKQPEQKILKLSDAFEKKLEHPELELLITMYNINLGQNPELLSACRTLKEYAQYVNLVRKYTKKMPFEDAVEAAVDDCIRNGILSDFLSKNRAEAIEMSIFEYDEEKHLKSERAYAYQEGKAEGKAEEKIQGIRILITICLKEKISKERIIETLKESYSLSQEEAETYYSEAKHSLTSEPILF